MKSQMMSVYEASVLWQVSERRVTGLCREGRVHGAVKNGKSWQIPVGTAMPDDRRVTSGNYVKSEQKRHSNGRIAEERVKPEGSSYSMMAGRSTKSGYLLEETPDVYGKKTSVKPLPIGISDYKRAVSEYYYVDKTLLIKEFLDEKPAAVLFTRPRRFGKTLNMDMLKTFFEKSEEDTSVYFKDKNIWRAGKEYQAYQGKYPVIFLTFKDVKFPTWEQTREALQGLIAQEANRHASKFMDELPTGVDDFDLGRLRNLISGTASNVELQGALGTLSELLHKAEGVKPVIIIDEYDVPIQEGYLHGFYEQVADFMRNLFSGAFKDNRHLSFGFMTGILKVAKESIFSGLNNLPVYSVLDEKYSQYFGFTAQEVMAMASYYGARASFRELMDWYDGYRFGSTEIFNPWSVCNYFQRGQKVETYWNNTSNNEVISRILKGADNETRQKITGFMKGETISSFVDLGVIYPEMERNPSSIFSFLLMTGYLKALKTELSPLGGWMCRLRIPNQEVLSLYHSEVLALLEDAIPSRYAIEIHEALFAGNAEQLKQALEAILKSSVSYFDTASESFYHGLVLGLLALFSTAYVTSNREAGEGRYDIALTPKSGKNPGIVIELKAVKGAAGLERAADQAIEQILAKDYTSLLLGKRVKKVHCFGVAFCGKQAAIKVGTIT